ncbi:adenylate kinase [Magnetofaba australis]|uniref:adenylate kinase n=1 Tax=Magnetofaba australis TaxID=1472297 RepID=UPI000A19F34E
MKRVAVFGKPGSGKSTLSRALSVATGLPLHAVDSLFYQADGDVVDRPIFDAAHDKIVASDHWILDGFGPMDAFHKRLEAADTLIYIDLPYAMSYWFVTKRLLKGVMIKPQGWPDGASVLKGSLQSYRVLKMCPKFWNQDFMARLKTLADYKTLYVIRCGAELNGFVDSYCRPDDG